VDFICGPAGAEKGFRWWQLEARSTTNGDSAPPYAVRALTSGGPLVVKGGVVDFARYQVRIGETGEAFEYREVNSGLALTPSWGDFGRDFLPCAADVSEWRGGVPEACRYLGQTLALQEVATNAEWRAWEDVNRLVLNREVLVGTSRNFKDKEHIARTPRPSIYGPAPTRGAVIVLPAGYLLSLRKYSWDQGKEPERLEIHKRYRAVLRKAFEAMNEYLDRGGGF
jgi:hypothetical protein